MGALRMVCEIKLKTSLKKGPKFGKRGNDRSILGWLEIMERLQNHSIYISKGNYSQSMGSGSGSWER